MNRRLSATPARGFDSLDQLGWNFFFENHAYQKQTPRPADTAITLLFCETI